MKSIICFAAHPDDIEFSCTGTLKKLFSKEYDTYFVILTNGENGFKAGKLDREQRIKIRRREQLEVAEKIGLKEVIFLDHKDGFLEYTEALRQDITGIIRRIKPEIIFSFDPANRLYDDINLFHRDHRVAAEAVFDACFAAKNHWMYPGKAHRVKKIYFFGSHDPNHTVDISDLMDYKLSLLACHKSQFPDFSKIDALIRERISPPYGEYRHAERFRVLTIEQRT